MIRSRRRWSFLVGVILVINAGGVCPGAVLSIGHRGNSLFAPENTVAAFKSALGKADMVEMDGQLTSDGKLVVMHDATVDRTTDRTGGIVTNTLALAEDPGCGLVVFGRLRRGTGSHAGGSHYQHSARGNSAHRAESRLSLGLRHRIAPSRGGHQCRASVL